MLTSFKDGVRTEHPHPRCKQPGCTGELHAHPHYDKSVCNACGNQSDGADWSRIEADGAPP
jgi:hypothetical protein